MGVRYVNHQEKKQTKHLTVLLQNLGEGENDSQFSESLAKSSDAYFRFGY
jgi:hypothetical protein